MATVELQNVQKALNGSPVIQGVNLELESGAFTVFVGPSGCGKTTLLRLIAGLEALDGGSIGIDGVRVDTLHPAKRGVAMVFQSYALYPHMTVYENMAFGLTLKKLCKAEITKKVHSVAEILQLERLLHRKPRELSGGQRQRVAIGRAIVREPKVFLFDEPLSNLDAKLRNQMRLELLKLHRHLKTTMIYVTHDQIEAMTMGQKIVVLNHGRVEQFGTPMELYQAPHNLFVADFIGSPAMNFLKTKAMRVEPKKIQVPLVEGEALLLDAPSGLGEEGEEVVLGIRPEHLELRSKQDSGLPVTIFAIERLGSHTLFHLQTPLKSSLKEHWVVQISGDTAFSVQQEASLCIPPAKCHLFNGVGNRLTD